jgi:flavin-dependent dehydrogenase
MTADYLIGADGAVSRVRNQLVGKLKREAYFKAHDFLVSKKGLPLHIGFEKGLNGYLWVFPRKDNCSIGVVDYADDKSARMQSLKNYLARFDVKEEEIIRKRSALIPSLRKEDLLNHTIAGDDWALVGDAAAMVEPITGEGIYYAVYSSSLLSECLKDGREYNVEWRHAFKQIVEEAAVSRSAYRYLNKGFMKFFLRRSSLMRRLTGQHLAAYKTGRTHRAQFFMKLPLVALQSLISKPVKLN